MTPRDPGPIGQLRQALVRTALNFVSKKVEAGFGMSLSALNDFERFLTDALQPNGGSDFRAAVSQFGAFVKLGPVSEPPTAEERLLMQACSALLESGPAGAGPMPPPTDLPTDLLPSWERLVERYRAGRPLIDVCTSGDPAAPCATDQMIVAALEDCFSHLHTIGQQLASDGAAVMFFPYLERRFPELLPRLQDIRDLLTPPWARGEDVAVDGNDVSTEDAQRAMNLLLEPLDLPATLELEVEHQRLAEFADSVSALSSMSVAGAQSYWVKLLRELPAADRESLLAVTCSAFVNANLDRLDSPARFLLPEWSLGDALLEAAKSLPPIDRGRLIETLWVSVRSAASRLQARAEELASGGAVHEPVDLARLDQCRTQYERSSVLKEMRQRAEPSLQALTSHPDARIRDHAKSTLELLDFSEELSRLSGKLDLIGAPATAVAVSPYFTYSPKAGAREGDQQLLSAADLSARPKPKTPPTYGEARGGKRTPISVVIEGGGGKGAAYPAVLQSLWSTLAESKQRGFSPDEYVGTSAGAITAAVLAAGIEPSALNEVVAQLDPSQFYKDYLSLKGGTEPAVGGTRRTGVFSTREMYVRLDKILREKLKVPAHRPVLFSDFPVSLKVVATVVANNLPAEARAQLGIGPDGKIVFGSHQTPAVDAVAAICASAAVPGFFDAPEMQLWVPNGTLHPDEYYLQLVDGGVLDNFPISEASPPDQGTACLVALPVRYQATVPSGDWLKPASLSTLDFEAPPELEHAVAQENRSSLGPALGALVPFLDRAAESGVGRVVLGLNLSTPDEHRAPVVQGRTREETLRLHALAHDAGLPHHDAAEGAEVVDRTYARRSTKTRVMERVFRGAIGAPPDEGHLSTSGDLIRRVGQLFFEGTRHADDRRFEAP